MAEAGYSPRSLVEKLGIKPGFSVVLLHTPREVASLFDSLSADIKLIHSLAKEHDFIHFFTKEKNELAKIFPQLASAVKKNGMVWISWPKESSKITTDLNENIIRDIGIENGMVDVKVIAINEQWSGLKFVYRLKDRGK